MTTIIFIVSVAVAISIGMVGSYILMMKLMTTKKGKKAVLDYSKELSDLAYELVKANNEGHKEMGGTDDWFCR